MPCGCRSTWLRAGWWASCLGGNVLFWPRPCWPYQLTHIWPQDFELQTARTRHGCCRVRNIIYHVSTCLWNVIHVFRQYIYSTIKPYLIIICNWFLFSPQQCLSMAAVGSHVVSGTFDRSWETAGYPSKKGCREHDRGSGHETFFGHWYPSRINRLNVCWLFLSFYVVETRTLLTYCMYMRHTSSQ